MPTFTPKLLLLNDVLVDFVSLKFKVAGKWRDVEAKQMSLLKLLVEHQGGPVSRETIMTALWPDVVVSDNSVSQLVTQLRKSLDDNTRSSAFIRTVPRVGYQLIAIVAEPPTLLDTITPSNYKKSALLMGLGVCIGLAMSYLLSWGLTPSMPSAQYQYVSRITSAPGTEVFLRYSPNGRYLAFSQADEQQSQFDLAVYDQQSKTVHSIKNSGYSEEAPVWSPDGKWLAYYRYDPLSCDIRVLSVANPIETWRISPDFKLAKCPQQHGPSKLVWQDENTLYSTQWHQGQPRLVKYTLKLSPYPKLASQQVYHDITAIAFDINTQGELLFLQQNAAGFSISKAPLANLSKQTLVKQSQYSHGPLLYDKQSDHFWLGDDALRLINRHGNEQIVHQPLGFIADVSVNPATGDVAHAEGRARVNLYQMQLDINESSLRIKQFNQLSSSARLDILPTMSADGQQTAFVSIQRRGITGFTHIEVWLKHQRRKTANLIATLPSNITPHYLLFSPNGDNLLLADKQQNIYLINILSRTLVPIISGFEKLNSLRWSSDSHSIFYQAKQQQQWQNWRYDIQLMSNSLVEQQVPYNDLSDAQPLWQLNPSYGEYEGYLQRYLIGALETKIPLSHLLPSIAMFKPASFKRGVYYILRRGHQLSLYCYLTDEKRNVFIKDLGNYGFNIDIPLHITTSLDGTQLVFSQVDALETDILIHKKITVIAQDEQ